MPWRANRVWVTTDGWAVCSGAGALQISVMRAVTLANTVRTRMNMYVSGQCRMTDVKRRVTSGVCQGFQPSHLRCRAISRCHGKASDVAIALLFIIGIDVSDDDGSNGSPWHQPPRPPPRPPLPMSQPDAMAMALQSQLPCFTAHRHRIGRGVCFVIGVGPMHSNDRCHCDRGVHT